MQRRRLAALAALGLSLTVGGCGKPEIVPMTPPGTSYRKMSSDTMEAEGEERSRGANRPVNVSPETSAIKPGAVQVGGPDPK